MFVYLHVHGGVCLLSFAHVWSSTMHSNCLWDTALEMMHSARCSAAYYISDSYKCGSKANSICDSLPRFYFSFHKCVIKASIIGYSVRVELRDEKTSWHQLSPWELLAAKDCGPRNGSQGIVQMIILFPANCMAWGACSFYLSINIITATLEGVHQRVCARVCRG